MLANNPRRRLTRSLAGAMLVAALAAPTAVARPAPEDSFRPQNAQPLLPVTTTTRASTPTVTHTIDDGFDLGSAAIGAGGATAALMLTAAAAAGSRRRRIRVIR
jgi:hypothetical protein